VDSGSSVFHLKMLNPQDFDSWRNQLKSFIPDRTPGHARRIYVVTDDSSDLLTVDLNPLFTANESMGRLIGELKKQSDALAQVRSGKGIADGVLNVFSTKSEYPRVKDSLNTA
jgi:oxysterol-binding protein-related protein 3/6/7